MGGRWTCGREFKKKVFFFEKKNQKTSVSLASRLAGRRRQPGKSLFASFSSEKEDLFPTGLRAAF
ncbi:hypothetical protein [Pseudoroseomonas cervicalis]|uniref:hypothetical protein n=1 Tax=Teichococcus cervicalis TaxID=204525 RepID=UPI0027892A59|nr:hypothetical protein [Pseudoroseomonas cervicalis]MDQ1080903.1 hypothetical protein [Pseudoroseomonas cervicalis]